MIVDIYIKCYFLGPLSSVVTSENWGVERRDERIRGNHLIQATRQTQSYKNPLTEKTKKQQNNNNNKQTRKNNPQIKKEGNKRKHNSNIKILVFVLDQS